MSPYTATKARYTQNQFEARQFAAKTIANALGVRLILTEWSGRVFENQKAWGEHKFDWAEISRKYSKEPSRFELAIWTGENRLSGLALALQTERSISLRFVEGDPRLDCPLKGKRILVALEAATNYAQLRGREEIRVEPINDRLRDLYQTVYGFQLRSPNNERPYYWRKV